MLYRETGQFKISYGADQSVFPIAQDRWFIAAALAFAFLIVPLIANEYMLQAVLIPLLIFSLAAIGLNLLVGYAGQLSLGTGGFMAVGAYMTYKLTTAFPDLNIIVVFVLAGLNALYFHVTLFKTVDQWEGDPTTPLAARVAGVASLALWAGVIVTGRLVSYDAFIPAWWRGLGLG